MFNIVKLAPETGPLVFDILGTTSLGVWGFIRFISESDLTVSFGNEASRYE